MIRKIFALFILSVICLGTRAQAQFVVDNATNRVGEIMFQSPKQVVFNFKNKGNRAMQIIDVKAACGCTKAEWTKGNIAPGDKGQIKVVYDAKTLGTFTKELAVFHTASSDPTYITIEGRVVTSLLDYSGDFPIDLGNIRINKNYVEFDDVNRGDHPVAEIQVFNQERTPYRPELMHLPAYLSMESVPEVIAGGRSGKILLTLNSEKLGLLGLNQTRVFISRFMGDKVGDDNEILVSSVLLPDLSKLTASQLERAPKMEFSHSKVSFGPMNGKSKQKQSIYITNSGKETLNIRTVQVFNQAISVSLGNRTLEPGKYTELKITVNAKYLKKAKSQPRVLLISNDPANPKQVIQVDVADWNNK